MPKDVQEELQYFVGTWKYVATTNDETTEGTMTVRGARGKYCVFGTLSPNKKGGDVAFSYILGWDASTGWLTERGVNAAGGVYTVTWTRTGPNVQKGKETGTQDGKEVVGAYTLEKAGPDSYTVKGVQESDTDRTEWLLKFTRVVKKKSRKSKK